MHNGELHNLSLPPNIISVKSEVVKWLEYIANMVEMKILSRVWRLYKTGFGLTTGFIKHSYNTCLHFTVYCNTHTHTHTH
jgi:hypothetical protein